MEKTSISATPKDKSRALEGEEGHNVTQAAAYFYGWAYEAAFEHNRLDAEWETWYDKMHHVAQTYEMEKEAGLYT